jgi:anti-sigma B factor antagonist
MQEGAVMFSTDLGWAVSGGHAVVALRGELDLVDAAAVATVLGDVAAREPRIIVDLSGLEFIDASGVAALSRGRRRARAAGGDLLLAAPQRRVQRVLALLWETGGPDLPCSVTEAAASAGSLHAAAPIRSQPTKMHWQRIALRLRIVTADWLSSGLLPSQGKSLDRDRRTPILSKLPAVPGCGVVPRR